MYYDETRSNKPAPPEPKKQPDATKLCRDCAHLAKSSVGDAQNWKCMAPQNIQSRDIDLVTGETIVRRKWLNCYEARGASTALETCGPEAKWFEPAPPKFMEVVPVPGRPGVFTSVAKGTSATDLLSQLDSMK